MSNQSPQQRLRTRKGKKAALQSQSKASLKSGRRKISLKKGNPPSRTLMLSPP